MSTSKLQRRVSELLSIHLGQYTIRENTRPDWLITPKGARLELDFYIEELEIAIEVQGRQHYVYIPYFYKNYDEFRQRREWDEFKQRQCARKDITLFEISNEGEAQEVILSLIGRLEIPQEPEWITEAKIYALKTVKESPLYAEYRRLKKKHKGLVRIHKKQSNRTMKRNALKLGKAKKAIHQALADEVETYRKAVLELEKGSPAQGHISGPRR